MITALYYSPEAYSISAEKLMGRNVAGSTFLEALIEFGQLEKLQLFVDRGSTQKQAIDLKDSLSRLVEIEVISPLNFYKLEEAGQLFLPGPTIENLCARRSFIGHSRWSTYGITHTTASQKAMDAIGSLITGPIQPWDALICTSPSVKSHVLEILEAKVSYLRHRFNIKKIPDLNLPVIPLGVDTRRFEALPNRRKKARSKLKLTENEVVFCFVGRLSWHAKAHPIPMYLALAEAAKKTGKKITIVECGWYANTQTKDAFEQTQKTFRSDIRFLHVDGRETDAVNDVYAASDIFISLSDNIQETFGITPIEAMAAGLPVVVSDWDGYRHSVRDGVDGFLIQTFVPAQTSSQDLIYRYEMNLDTYDYYCGHTSMTNIVDVGQLISRIIQLVESKELRKKMGKSGKMIACERFDWSVIIRKYFDLWEMLDEIRAANQDPILTKPTIWPERLDPMIAFKEYPTKKLKVNDLLKTGAAYSSMLEQIMRDHMVDYAKQVICSPERARTALEKLKKDTFTVGELAALVAPDNLELGMRFVGNLVKFDVVRLLNGTSK